MTSIDELFAELNRFKIPFGEELRMQNAIESILKEFGRDYLCEERLSATDRIDFLVDSIGIECKVKGSRNAVLSQLLRYAESDRINGLILVTTRNTHRFGVEELLSKPLRVLTVRGI